ncbi:MAG: cellulase family glycosylhydrolase [Filimonas sp.]|nr:cellulase family glycosylhydrolase [Filimonas sp.]
MSHNRFLRFAFLLVALAASCYHLSAQGFLRADGQRIVNEKGENVLLRGIGLGGWMLQEGYMLHINKEGQQHLIRKKIDSLIGPEKTKEFYDAWLANNTRKTDIDSLKKWGFNSVRLPMHFDLYTLPVDQEKDSTKDTWLTKGFEMTDKLLAWCKANKIYLILDLHAAPSGQGNDLNISDRDGSKPSLWQSSNSQRKTIALWKKLAERYANEPWIGGYDIINEPNWGFDDPANDRNGLKEQHNAPLKKLMEDITTAIRQVDKKHIVIIEGNGWGNNYNGILPTWDNNMVLSFHKYWNYNDTNSIRHIINTRTKYNVPVWVGETGENSNVWYTEAIRLMEDHNIGWAWWPLKKLGNNNPLEVKSNPDYDKVAAYINGGPKPDAATAYKGVMTLANALKTENNIVHRDVIDAMFRQPHNATAIPFKSNVITNNTVLSAVDYDLGINGVAYFDKDTADYHVSKNNSRGGNRGRTYRNDGVDITKDSLNNIYVMSTEAGEWLQYTVTVSKTGKYAIGLTTAAKADGGKAAISLDGVAAINDFVIPAGNWATHTAGNIELSKGRHVLRVQIVEGGFNLKDISFTAAK